MVIPLFYPKQVLTSSSSRSSLKKPLLKRFFKFLYSIICVPTNQKYKLNTGLCPVGPNRKNIYFRHEVWRLI